MCTKAPSFDPPLKHQAQAQGGPQRMLAGEEEVEEEGEGGKEGKADGKTQGDAG